jgi:hypothetical protein
MNRFEDLLNALLERPQDPAVQKLLETLESIDPVSATEEKEPDLRLPYASDPPPVGQPWA